MIKQRMYRICLLAMDINNNNKQTKKIDTRFELVVAGSGWF